MKKTTILIMLVLLSISVFAISNTEIYNDFLQEHGSDNLVRINDYQFVYFYHGNKTVENIIEHSNITYETTEINTSYNYTINVTEEFTFQIINDTTNETTNVTDNITHPQTVWDWVMVNETTNSTTYWNETTYSQVEVYRAMLVEFDDTTPWAYKTTIISEVVVE